MQNDPILLPDRAAALARYPHARVVAAGNDGAFVFDLLDLRGSDDASGEELGFEIQHATSLESPFDFVIVVPGVCMSELVVWGIPSCSTVKKARAFLTARGLAHRFADLRSTPPSSSTIGVWVEAFGTKALRNTSGGSYRALPDDKDRWSDARWIEAFAADPMLIKRPIIERAGQAVLVGFKDDDVARVFG